MGEETSGRFSAPSQSQVIRSCSCSRASTLASRLFFFFPQWRELVHLVHSLDVDLWIIDTKEILDGYEKSLSTNIPRQAWWQQSMLAYLLPALAWRAARRQARWFRDDEEGILLVCKRELIQHSWFLINSSVIYNRHGLRAQTARLPLYTHTHSLSHTDWVRAQMLVCFSLKGH